MTVCLFVCVFVLFSNMMVCCYKSSRCSWGAVRKRSALGLWRSIVNRSWFGRTQGSWSQMNPVSSEPTSTFRFHIVGSRSSWFAHNSTLAPGFVNRILDVDGLVVEEFLDRGTGRASVVVLRLRRLVCLQYISHIVTVWWGVMHWR